MSQKKGLASILNCVRPEFCASTYRNVTPHFENLKYRRIPYNMIIKVTEFIRIGIVDSCVSKPASPFRLIHLKLNSTFTSIKTESFPKISTYVLLPAVPKFPSPPIVISSMSPADTVT